MNQPPNTNQSLQAAITTVLSEIAKLPPTDPAWNLLPDFVGQLQAALTSNQELLAAQAAETAQRQAGLEAELEKLCGNTSHLLNFFGFKGCESGWLLEEMSPAETDRALTNTTELLKALLAYESLEAEVDAADSYQAKRDARMSVQKQGDQIAEMIESLQAILPTRKSLVDTETETAATEDEQDTQHVEDEFELETAVANDAQDIQQLEDELELETAFTEDEQDRKQLEGELELETAVANDAQDIQQLEDELGLETTFTEDEQDRKQLEGKLELETAVANDAQDIQPLENFDLTSSQWEEFFWQLVSEGDLAGAYWLTRSLASQSPPISMPLSERLLEAVLASWWLSQVNGQIQQDLFEIVYTHTLNDQPNDRILAISVAMAGILVSSRKGLGRWLIDEPLLPQSVRNIIYELQNFSDAHSSLPVEDIQAVYDEKLREETQNKLAAEAKQWLAEEPNRKTTLKRATDVWLSWTDLDGPLRKMIEVVSRNDAKKVGRLQQLIKEWRDQSNLKWLEKTDRQLIGRRPNRPIDGKIRDRLLNGAESSVQLAEKWLALVNSHDNGQSASLEDAGKLVNTISGLTSNALSDLSTLEQNPPLDVSPLVIRILAWSLSDLNAILRQPEVLHDVKKRAYLSYPDGIEISLKSGLHFRLICIPGADVPSDSFAEPKKLSSLAAKLFYVYQQKQTLTDIFLAYLNQADYRFTDILLLNMPPDGSVEFNRKLQAAKQHSFDFLRNKLREVGDAIEQSMVNGLLDENSRAAYTQEIETIGSGKNLNYKQLKSRLSQIESELHEMEQDHLQLQLSRWKTVYHRLKAAIFYSTKKQLIKDINDFVNSAFSRQDIIVVDELLARLEVILDSGTDLNEREFTFEAKRDIYQEFVDNLELWERRDSELNFRNLHIKQLAQNLRRDDPSSIQSLRMGPLTKPRKEEVISAFSAWGSLKGQSNPNSRANLIEKHVTTLLDYLGFSSINGSQNIVSYEKGGSDWAYLTAAVSAGDKSPIPQFGSQHARSFDVICLWERPGSEKISASLNNLRLNTHHVIVLYLGRLTQRWRIDLMQQMRKESLSLLILDELLLLFLAREKELRLPSFFQTTLPLTRANPYSETGPVPAEMFRGRIDERRQLREPLGYSIVYGGRQLGKSALLQQVERDFHNPASDRYVIRREIKSIGDTLTQQADPELVWQVVKQGLVEADVLKTASTRPDSIASDIRQMMLQNPGRSILVLLDEADNFLAADESRNFEIVGALKAIMESTDRRFKVIFAGLHDVQRYEQVPNQPFAHLRGLGVGPLDAQAAKQLIRQPLESLGFRFPQNDESPILGITAYSNSHPGLLQLFCHRLLEMLYQQMPNNLGPHLITREDVDAIYRQREVQEAIRQRFHWTLDLDSRYRALAQIIVLEQMQDYEGFTRAYSVAELQQLVKSYLPSVFHGVDQDELRVYLKEMIGLGVLVRNTDSQYRLRSPNLVRLVGNEEEIINSLAEMEAKPPTKEALLESYRAPLNQEANRYSPFTFAQSRMLNARQYGVGLVFGSQALGIEAVTESIKAHFIPPGSPGKHFEATPHALPGDSFSHWLKRLLDDNGSQLERMIVTRRIMPGLTAEEIRDQVNAAISFCKRHQRGHYRWMRVIFIFDSLATLEWLKPPMEEVTSIENLVDATVKLRKWEPISIKQRLQRHDKMSSESVIKKIWQQTGGWPILFDQLADSWKNNDDPLPASTAIRNKLDNDDAFALFIQQIGGGVDKQISHILQTVAQYEDFPYDLLVPDILGSELTQADCDRAVEYLKRMRLIIDSSESVIPDHLIRNLTNKP
ncbi:MAG: hypothetical protein H6656_00395 [Ardenticatenaceae bacterium]|nr:hypothetical protein [Ardenticatenaceae bacterium]